jgi:hypothetical protein
MARKPAICPGWISVEEIKIRKVNNIYVNINNKNENNFPKTAGCEFK